MSILLGSAVALLTGLSMVGDAVDAWDKVGWKTPAGHTTDMNELRAEFVAAQQAEKSETEQFRNEWRCSEWAQDLEDLYREQAEGDDSQQMRDKISSLREKMDEAGCDEYEDY